MPTYRTMRNASERSCRPGRLSLRPGRRCQYRAVQLDGYRTSRRRKGSADEAEHSVRRRSGPLVQVSEITKTLHDHVVNLGLAGPCGLDGRRYALPPLVELLRDHPPGALAGR